MEQISRSEQDTLELGKKIAETLHGGDIVLLHGELGAGKTTLVKGIAQGLGIKEDITSPTFTLMNVYRIRNQEPACRTGRSGIRELVHIDTYRLNDEKELIDIGVEDYLGDQETIWLIEWPEKLHALLEDKKCMRITLYHSEEGRRIQMP